MFGVCEKPSSALDSGASEDWQENGCTSGNGRNGKREVLNLGERGSSTVEQPLIVEGIFASYPATMVIAIKI